MAGTRYAGGAPGTRFELEAIKVRNHVSGYSLSWYGSESDELAVLFQRTRRLSPSSDTAALSSVIDGAI